MPFAFRVSWCSLALSLTLIGPALAQSPPPSSAFHASQASDESAVRAMAEMYFALYAAKDIDGLLNLWSKKSPDYASLKQNLQRQFAAEDSSFGSPTISRVKVEADQASLRATVNAAITELKSNHRRELQIVRNFVFVRESGKWKVWRYVSAGNDLAEALVQAKTEAERSGLLAEERELVTVELVRAVIDQGNRFLSQGDYPRALAIYHLAQSRAEQIDDKTGVARALDNIGKINRLQGNYTQALEYHLKSLAISEAIGDRNRDCGHDDEYWDHSCQTGQLSTGTGVLPEGLGDARGPWRQRGNRSRPNRHRECP